jgi:hypothetical protein
VSFAARSALIPPWVCNRKADDASPKLSPVFVDNSVENRNAALDFR